MRTVVTLIQIIANLITFVVIIDALVSFFLSPYHPVRSTLDRIVNPMLAPIRRILPPMQGLDFSPMVLILLVQLLEMLLVNLLY